ncbi:MAG: hypothetical protein ACM3NQ_13315 [Bacteroidales bacterium]
MTIRRSALTRCAILILAVVALSANVTARKTNSSGQQADTATLPERIWRDSGDVSTLDLRYGAGGKAHAPDAAGPFTFVKEDLLQTSPKFEVVDAQGVQWKVKLGEESQSETAATRFLWAAGYFTDEDYYMADLTVNELPALRRGQQFLSSGGVVHGARLERKVTGTTKLETWDWFANPFVGQRELNGLRVMMSLLNNWDLKDINNSVYVVDGERHYLVSDVGATFGNTGNAMTRSKGMPKEYEATAFIGKVTPGFIDFVLHSRPFFLSAVQPGNYRDRTRMEDVTRHIPRADAKWLGERLSVLTDDQIRDGFRAGGYGASDVEILTRTIRTRITALGAL